MFHTVVHGPKQAYSLVGGALWTRIQRSVPHIASVYNADQLLLWKTFEEAVRVLDVSLKPQPN
jgi:hypothetical protein